jgi:hypothetical protein
MLVLACTIGLLHSASSLYWAAGGQLLLPTVGTWAMRWRSESPLEAGGVLAVVGLLKLTAAVGPLVLERWVLGRWRVGLRAILWASAAGMLVWGLANAVGAWLIILGVVPMSDPAGTYGHAVLWDPLFGLWALALIAGLRRTAPQPVVWVRVLRVGRFHVTVVRKRPD